MLYLLDANVLIGANHSYYPIERVPEFWDWLIAMGEREHIKIPLEMSEEITVGTDDVAKWMRDSKDALLLRESVNEDLVKLVTEQGYANDLNDARLRK